MQANGARALAICSLINLRLIVRKAQTQFGPFPEELDEVDVAGGIGPSQIKHF
jgi:hypothetical protein